MVDVSGNGLNVVECMGLLLALRRKAVALSELVYRSGDGGITERFVDDSTGSERKISLMRHDLELELHRALGEQIPIRFGTTVDAVREREDHLEITVSGGELRTVDLLIGADGLHILEAPGRPVGVYPVGDRIVATFTHRVPAGHPLPSEIPADLDERYRQLGWVVPRTGRPRRRRLPVDVAAHRVGHGDGARGGRGPGGEPALHDGCATGARGIRPGCSPRGHQGSARRS